MSLQGGMGGFEKFVRMIALFVLIGVFVVGWWTVAGQNQMGLGMQILGSIAILVLGGIYYERLSRA